MFISQYIGVWKFNIFLTLFVVPNVTLSTYISNYIWFAVLTQWFSLRGSSSPTVLHLLNELIPSPPEHSPEDLISKSLEDTEREWAFLGSHIDWQAVSDVACELDVISYLCAIVHFLVFQTFGCSTFLFTSPLFNIFCTVPIITKFTYRTNGTCQSPRIPGIGWSYFGADPEEGYKQSKQLTVSWF